jgi:hypothetical protein
MVYEPANWLYLGVGVGRGKALSCRWRFLSRRESRRRSTRSLRKRRTVLADLRSHPEWIAEWLPDFSATEQTMVGAKKYGQFDSTEIRVKRCSQTVRRAGTGKASRAKRRVDRRYRRQ